MVWNGKGRSGIGDQYTGGTWGDWQELSPNGRQFKNPLTKEVRNLSGADYWHARKADNARMLNKALPNHFNPNGSANISAYKEEDKKTKADSSTLEYKLFPQQRTLDNLEKLEAEVERQYFEGEIDEEQYYSAMNALDIKKERAWIALCKAKGWQEELEEIQIRKDIEKLSKQIEKQKEKNERLMQNAMNPRGRQRGKQKGSGFPWLFVLAFVFVYCFIL